HYLIGSTHMSFFELRAAPPRDRECSHARNNYRQTMIFKQRFWAPCCEQKFGQPHARSGLVWIFALLAILPFLTVATRGFSDEDDADNAAIPAQEISACAKCDRPDDEVWLLDDRHSGCLDEAGDVLAALQFQRYDMATHQWRSATAAEFFDGPGA